MKTKTKVHNAPVRSAKRHDDAITAAEILGIMTRRIGPSSKLQAVQVVLKRNETVNNVLMSVGPGVLSRGTSVRVDRSSNHLAKKHNDGGYSGNGNECEKDKNAALTAGTSALHMTDSETLLEREKKIKKSRKRKRRKPDWLPKNRLTTNKTLHKSLPCASNALNAKLNTIKKIQQQSKVIGARTEV